MTRTLVAERSFFVFFMPVLSALTRRFALIAPLLGVGISFALPPYGMSFVLVPLWSLFAFFIGVMPSLTKAFYVGWLFGVGYFGSSLYWITHSFAFGPAMFAPLAIPSVMLMVALLSLYVAFACVIICALRRSFRLSSIRYVTMFAAVWTLVEMARGFLFLGFPWNINALFLSSYLPLLQGASLTGVWGVSFLVTWVSCSLAACLSFDDKKEHAVHVAMPPLLVMLMMSAAVVYGAWFWGAQRMETALGVHDDIRLHMVQGNIPQGEKWDVTLREKHHSRHLRMSIDDDVFSGELGALQVESTESQGRRIIIWPETAITTYPDRVQSYLDIASLLRPGDMLMSGAIHREVNSDGKTTSWNSLFVFNADGRVEEIYDKVRLVPFGEYVPTWHYFPLHKVIDGFHNFAAGEGRRTLVVSDHIPPLSPLICYEAIFPHDATVSIRQSKRPQWLVNITNDAWFGDSIGVTQHFFASRMRAIEEGLPMARVANTGISALIDAHGRILHHIPVETAGVIRHPLPKPLHERTFYSAYGNAPVLLFLLLGLAFLITPIHPPLRR
ncbi:MAG: apolipoprotein N-acyltransferase [Alphaproteobacteria bacterium GM7ARS4]|nr:apolipoprotein N-acyltransferase [Alphaproteobacteria bacterium GM7ARS4]